MRARVTSSCSSTMRARPPQSIGRRTAPVDSVVPKVGCAHHRSPRGERSRRAECEAAERSHRGVQSASSAHGRLLEQRDRAGDHDGHLVALSEDHDELSLRGSASGARPARRGRRSTRRGSSRACSSCKATSAQSRSADARPPGREALRRSEHVCDGRARDGAHESAAIGRGVHLARHLCCRGSLVSRHGFDRFLNASKTAAERQQHFRALRWQTGHGDRWANTSVRDGGRYHRGVGADRAALPLFRHVAARHQYRDDDRHVPDGVLDPARAEQRRAQSR